MKNGFFRRHSHWWVVAIVLPLIAVAVGFGIWQSLSSYNAAQHGTTKAECNAPGNNLVYIAAVVIAVDTDSLTATLRLAFQPSGNLADEDTSSPSDLTLKSPLTVVTAGLLAEPPGSTSFADASAGAPPGAPSYTSASSSYVFLKGESMQDLDVTLPLLPGTLGNPSPPGTSSARYPWDSYTDLSAFSFFVRQGIGTGGPYVASCAGLTSSLGGWTMSTQFNQIDQNNEYQSIDVSFGRSSPVKFYSYFVMALMWALALGGVAMAVIMMMRKQDEIDTAAFAYLAALLFAFPLIRQTLPGNPGPGSLIDILAYYWTEVIVAITLVVLLARWITIKGKQDRQEHQEDPDEGPRPEDEVVEPVL
ncbi:MAG TPA: DUF4436 family protein [Acidimicrobiales bacterium]